MIDVGRQLLEVCVVRLRFRSYHDIIRKCRWKEPQSNQLSYAPLEPVARHGAVSVARHDQSHARARNRYARSRRMRERGSDDPDIEMSGPNALPLSRDALQLRTPRDPCMPRKAERRFGRSRLRRTCPESGR